MSASRDRPVQEVRPIDRAIFGQHAPLVLLKAKRRARPVGGAAADGLADPGGQARKVLWRHAPAAAGRSRLEPGKLQEETPTRH